MNSHQSSPEEFAKSRKAPKKDRIRGSKKNKKGSASGGKKITFSKAVEASLRKKMEAHNKKAPDGRKATMGQLKAAYRRGAGAYSSSHRPGQTRASWAMARVNAYLRLLKSGRPSNPNYKQDNDLLPKGHPKSTKGEAAIVASAHEDYVESQLEVNILAEQEYATSEHAIFALAEMSGQGYEIIPALRAAWLRGVRDKESPFARAALLASGLYNSSDADLLPRLVEEDVDDV